MDKPRLYRLSSILTQLQSKRIVTARDLAEKHQVSIRTIYRDINTLENSGIPIITREGIGYSIMEGYMLPPVMFTEQEANALITAEQIINKNKDQSLSDQYRNAITKLKSVLKHSQKEKTELLEQRIHIRNNPVNEKTSKYLIEFQSAITNSQIVHIEYLSLEKIHSEREIEPFAFYSTNDNWILVAFCRSKNDFRAFRLDCIKKIKFTGLHFEQHKTTLEEYFEQNMKKCTTTPDIPLS